MTFVIIPISAVILHVMPYLSSIGVARSTFSMVAMAIPLVSIVGRLSAGWLGDKFKKIQVATRFIVLVGLGLLLFSFVTVHTMWLVILFVPLLGIS